jgi:3-oxoacyl-[acyl-carrier protein] reductase
MAAQTVLITGGNKGIGLLTTQLFLDAGYHVYVLARDFAEFSLNDNERVTTISYDLTDIEGIPDLVRTLPAFDVLINNAGIMHAAPYNDYPTEKLNQLLDINIKAPVALITELSQSMISRGSGRIVNNASIAGEIGHPDIWYGISKAGMINITKSFAKIMGPSGIVINAVAAGPVETDMLDTIPEPRKKQLKAATHLGRFAYPQEVADTMFWLGTSSPEYINGTCIDLNNGSYPR